MERGSAVGTGRASSSGRRQQTGRLYQGNLQRSILTFGPFGDFPFAHRGRLHGPKGELALPWIRSNWPLSYRSFLLPLSLAIEDQLLLYYHIPEKTVRAETQQGMNEKWVL